MDKPTLDAAALDAYDARPDEGDIRPVIAQARLALSQAERIATLEAELAEEVELRERLASICKRTALALKGPEPELQSHSWADLPAYAVLQVEVEARLIADLNRVLAHANALRDALADVLNNATCACYEDGEPGHCPRCAVAYQEARTTLSATPVASLAEHDAEVLERAAKAVEGVCGVEAPIYAYVTRALAAQEVK